MHVTFTGGAAHGKVYCLHPRLSDNLLEAADAIELSDATMLPSGASRPVCRHGRVYLNLAEILFLIDLSPKDTSVREAYVPREVVSTTINVGRYWITGALHLPPGADPGRALLGASGNQFVPITRARLVGSDDPPRAFLVNRERICGLAVHGPADA